MGFSRVPSLSLFLFHLALLTFSISLCEGNGDNGDEFLNNNLFQPDFPRRDYEQFENYGVINFIGIFTKSLVKLYYFIDEIYFIGLHVFLSVS
jgi:hypothetical protein